jgi:hypothetical protein
MKTYEEVDLLFHSFLTSVKDTDEWSASGPGRFTPCKKFRCPLNRRLGRRQSQFQRFGQKTIFFFLPGIKNDSSDIHPVPYSLNTMSYPGSMQVNAFET